MTQSHAGSPVIDAHHHLWHYNAEEFSWMDEGMRVLRRHFDTHDLALVTMQAQVDRTLVVQARQSLTETRDLLAAARECPLIAGVVGWLPLSDADALEAALREFAGEPLLRGARHVVQAEPAGFLDRADFDAGLRCVAQRDLCYDLLLHAKQIPEAIRCVDRHPHLRFVLDHLAKPEIAGGTLEPWRRDLLELARRDNVVCKVSGMVTEAVWTTWSLDTLRPYLDHAVEAFGVDRLLAGSDWPVCLVASTYSRWWQTLRAYFASFSLAERNAIFGGNAERWYGLAAANSTPGVC